MTRFRCYKVRVLLHRDDAVLPDVWEWDQCVYPSDPTESVKQALRCKGLWFGDRDALPRATVGRTHRERGVEVCLVSYDMGHWHTETRIDAWGRAHDVDTWIPHPCRARVEVAEGEWPKAIPVRSRRWNAVYAARNEIVDRFIRRGGMRVEMRGRKCVGLGYDGSEVELDVPSVRMRDSADGRRKVEARLRTLYARRPVIGPPETMLFGIPAASEVPAEDFERVEFVAGPRVGEWIETPKGEPR